MRRVLSILIVLGILGGFARAYNSRNPELQSPAPASSQDDDEGETKMVDLAADIVYPYDIAPDSSVICMVGNFIGHHNGAVITCDSAVRYSDQRLECFGNVLINKNDTYIYGDRADYNGSTNRAEVYSPLVKVIDGDATLYTYKFLFDTKLNIGEFDNGGVITNRDNLLESDRGYYYADRKEVVGVDRVEMRNDTYQMTGDSVIYNIETDNARFFTHTNIWNDKGEYLYADRGDYDSYDERYVITQNGYILTELREIWSDSLDYYRETGYALLRNDIQIDDIEHKVLSFGDWGEYWDADGNAVLTREPSIVSYDPEQGDSLFMRADTIWMHTRSTFGDLREAEEAKMAEEAMRVAAEAARAAEEAAAAGKEPDAAPDVEVAAGESHTEQPVLQGETADAAASAVPAESSDNDSDSAEDAVTAEVSDDGQESSSEDAVAEDREIGEDTDEEAVETEDEEVPLSELSKEERRERLREIAEQERAEKKRIAEERKKEKAAALKAKLAEIAERRQEKRNIQLEKQERRDSIAAAKSKAREEAKRRKALERLSRKGIKLKPADAATLAEVDSIISADMHLYDSLAEAMMDSMFAAWLPFTDEADSVLVDSSTLDTVYRLVRGFRNVRMYRSDFQAVCDSLSSSTLDSVVRMYIEPVLWNEENQITSEQTDIHTKNQQLDYAEFIGKPMMISKIDTLHFNQVAGKTMYSYFRENEIYRDDVDGNAETIYYMQDDATHEVQGLMYITSADMTFYIEDKQITGITYRGNPEYTVYPMEKIPETQELFLNGFTWQDYRRPSRDSVFTRVIRPSLRAEKEALPLPSFPISKQIESFKVRLMEQDRWYDRDETLSGDVIYWLDMNTDWREQNARDREMRERQTQGRRRERAAAAGELRDSSSLIVPAEPLQPEETEGDERPEQPITEPEPLPEMTPEEEITEPESESEPQTETTSEEETAEPESLQE